jgi:hypothetical protein
MNAQRVTRGGKSGAAELVSYVVEYLGDPLPGKISL